MAKWLKQCSGIVGEGSFSVETDMNHWHLEGHWGTVVPDYQCYRSQWLKWFYEAGEGSPDEARLEQTPYPFQPH